MCKKRWRGYLDAAALFACEVALFGFFVRARPWLGSVDLWHLSRWLEKTGPQEALTASFRLLGLVISGWLLTSTCMYALAVLIGKRAFLRGARLITLPVLRRVLDAAATASVVAASFGAGTGSVSASPLPSPAPVVRALLAPRTVRQPLPQTVTQPSVRVSPTAIGRHFPHPGPVSHTLPPRAPAAGAGDAPSEANGFAGLPTGTKVVVVRPGDCLSVIAERHLGDWRLDAEIEALNWGRLQPDGRALVDDHWIYPGWVLIMPPKATGTLVVGGQEPSEAVGSTAVGSGSRSTPARLSAAPADQPGARTLASATAQQPVPTLAQTTAQQPAPTPAAAQPVRAEEAVRPSAAQEPRPHGDPGLAVAVGLGAIGAAGLIWRLNRSRREQLHARLRGTTVARNRPEVEAAERRARAIARPEAAEWVDLGLRYLSGLVEQVLQEQATVPSVSMVLAGRTGLEVVVAGQASTGLGWFRPAVTGESLVLDPEVDLEDLKVLAGEHWCAWPALVNLGESENGGLLLNLEHAGSLAVEGEPAQVEKVLAGIALQLASQPWSDEMLAGLYVLGNCPLDRRLAQIDWVGDARAEELAERLRRVSGAHRELAGAADLGALRAATCEALPNVAIAFGGVPAPVQRSLVEAAVPASSGVAVVGAGACEGARWRLTLTGEDEGLLQGEIGARSVCLALRLDCDRKEVVLLSEAMGAAAEQEAGREDGGGDGSGGIADVIDVRENADNPRAFPHSPGAERGLVEMCILGPVDLPGGNLEVLEPSRRVPALAAIAYVAAHDRPVTADELGGALWPLDINRDDLGGPQRKTVMNVISRARALLGYGTGGQERLAYTAQGYRLASDVTCDWVRFVRLARLASSQGSAEAMATLHRALELVRGEPFSGSISSHFFEWASSEHLDLTISANVADIAEELGQAALDAGNYAEAIWAVEKGLQLDPAREELFRMWMHALGRSGRPGGVDKVYRRLRLVLQRRIHPLHEPQAQSRAVWRLYTAADMADV